MNTPDVPLMGVARRTTTSSRKPGAKIEGSHAFVLVKIVVCPLCGVKRYGFGGPHAPAYRDDGALVDCVGNVLRAPR